MTNKLVWTMTLLLASISLSWGQVSFSSQAAALPAMEEAPALHATGHAVANWETANHDFGEVRKGSTPSHTFTFVNRGSRPLLIERVKPSCGCTATHYTEEAVGVAERGSITVEYDATKPGFFHKSVSVTFKGASEAVSLTFKGQVVE